ncbi:MAG TPA: hypothetical protein VHK65_08010 [Candidatus Dormibacteraeota bacterium]|nr:hypothetical protein [Candidatus Dormibacteraeota bacterium]
MLESLRRALGIGTVPVSSEEAFSQFLNWGFALVAAMLAGALIAGGFYSAFRQAPVWLNVVMWFVVMAAPAYALSRSLRSYFRYLRLRVRERRGT